MNKRLISFMLAAVLLVCLLPASALAVEVEGGWTGVAGTTDTMAYKYNAGESDSAGFSFVTGGNFNIHGTFNNCWKQTTFNDCGFYTFFQNDLVSSSNAPVKVDGSPQNTSITDVTLDVDLNLVYNGKGVQVVYTVANNSAAAITYSLGSAADIKIGSDDSAAITCLTSTDNTKYGFSMVSDKDADKDGNGEYPHFNFFGAAAPGMVTDVDTFYVGEYSYAAENLYTNNRVNLTYTDSGMAYSWKNRTLAAGATAVYKVLFSIGGADSVNIVHASVDYLRGSLTGLDAGANYEISVVIGGQTITYSLTADNYGRLPLKGVDKNGKTYNFYEKTLKIVKKGSAGVPDSDPQEVQVESEYVAPSTGLITYTYEDWLRDNQYDTMAPASGLQPDKSAPAEELFPSATIAPATQAPLAPAAAEAAPPQTGDANTLAGYVMLLLALAVCAGAANGYGRGARGKKWN